MKISATIITLNEEQNIQGCLDSLIFADEIVVVDSGSTDRTEELCRANPRVRFFRQEWQGFGRQKNSVAELAANDWIFNIDADERVSDRLRDAILSADLTHFAGFRVARENYFGNRRVKRCGWYPDYNVRLYNRNSSRFSERTVHEAVSCDGPVGTLEGNLIHHTYSGISDYLQRMNRYSTLAAEQMITEGKRPLLIDILFRPLFTFWKMFVLKKGFLEGYSGFLLSSLYSCYTFCKYAKARELLASMHKR